MIRVGITGQTGFVGTHLFNTLGLYPDKFQRVPFEDDFFQDDSRLAAFVKSCDAIVHLAAMNRHNDPQVIYDTNIRLVKKLIGACNASNVTPHILFSSSTQEERDNLYGKSKREGRLLFENWAKEKNAFFTGLIIPNVYGPFGHPYYNSVVATFCHQLTHNEVPKIEVDVELNLIYVGELVDEIIKLILSRNENDRHSTIYTSELNTSCETIKINPTGSIKVSALLAKLQQFKQNYFGKGEIPSLNDVFERNLWNTFLCYVDHESFFPYIYKLNTDNRGSFVEVIRLNSGGQISFSTTKPGITRGNHFHTRKAERFAVIKGKARIELRRIGTNKIMTFELDGAQPSFVDMPIWHTHNITNIGEGELYTIFWINEHYEPEDPDTFFERV